MGKDIDMEAQERAYRALLTQAGGYEKVKGIFWWQWELNGAGGITNGDYTPRDKPAQGVIKEYWGN